MRIELVVFDHITFLFHDVGLECTPKKMDTWYEVKRHDHNQQHHWGKPLDGCSCNHRGVSPVNITTHFNKAQQNQVHVTSWFQLSLHWRHRRFWLFSMKCAPWENNLIDGKSTLIEETCLCLYATHRYQNHFVHQNQCRAHYKVLRH